MTRMPLSIVLLAGLALTGCATGEDIVARTMPVSERHPILVEPEVVELRLVPSEGEQGLSLADQARLSAFVSEFMAKSDADLQIAVPDGALNARLAVKAAGDARQVVEGMGMPSSRVTLGAYPATPSDGDAPIVVTYVAYRAKAPECGNWSENIGYNPDNQATPNYGCAMQRNIAAVVADPRDLIEPRPETPADAARRATVLEKYRRGESTQTQRQQDERGTVSTVGN
jgi:pilus assembly protein CpaD